MKGHGEDGLDRLPMRGERRALAFVLTLLLVLQTGVFSCFGESVEADAVEASFVYGWELRPGNHVLLGATVSDGYDFTVLDTMTDGMTGAGLLFYSDPLGLEQTPQQFDQSSPEHPDEDSQAEGYSLWKESDLYIALNGALQDGSTDTHGAKTEAAGHLYEALTAKESEWSALLSCESGESDGEKVSLLSETEYGTYREEAAGDLVWNTGIQAEGYWLKTARGGYSEQVRYIHSDDIPPSLSPTLYYATARSSYGVRPALRLDLGAVKFKEGSGTAADPYRELTLRPRLESLELRGTVKVGEELTVHISPGAADCEYRWYREQELLKEVTGSAYTLTEDDVSCIIRAEAVASGDYIGTVETLTTKVDKGEQKAPEGEELPRVENTRVTDRKVTLMATGGGLEYALVTAAAVTEPTAATPREEPQWAIWTSQGAFTGLSAVTAYELYARRAEQKAYYASPAAEPLRVTTKQAGAEVTLVLSAAGWDPKKQVEVLLVPMQIGEGGVTLSAVSTTASGVGRTTQTVTISGIGLDMPYTLRVQKPGHLDYVQENVNLTENESMAVMLACGDVDGDGSIGWGDRQLLLSARYFGKAVEGFAEGGEQRKQAELCDLDGDGEIRLSDLYILMQESNYGRKVCVQ